MADIKKRYIYNLNLFNEDTEESLYWAGFIAADGNITNNCLSVSLAEKDKKHLEKLNKLLCCSYKIVDFSYSGYPSFRFSVSSKEICKQVGRFNILPNKSLIYSMPDWLIKHKYINHFLRGYSDGDFCWRIFKVKNGVDRTCFKMIGTKIFLQQVLKIFENNCNINLNNKTIYSASNSKAYRCDFGGNVICSKIYDFIYKDATIFLERKEEIAKKSKELRVHKCEITKEKLIKLYIEDNMSQIDIAKKLGYSPGSISLYMRKFKIIK